MLRTTTRASAVKARKAAINQMQRGLAGPAPHRPTPNSGSTGPAATRIVGAPPRITHGDDPGTPRDSVPFVRYSGCWLDLQPPPYSFGRARPVFRLPDGQSTGLTLRPQLAEDDEQCCPRPGSRSVDIVAGEQVARARPTRTDRAQDPDAGVSATGHADQRTTRGRPGSGIIDGLIGHLLDLDIAESLCTNHLG